MRIHTNSSIGTWRLCKRRYKYEYVDKIRPVAKSAALGCGSAVHEGLEVFKRGGALISCIEAVDRYCAREDFRQIEGWEVEHRKARALITAYYERWSKTRDYWDFVGVEGSFLSQIAPTSKIAGKRDGVAIFRPENRAYLHENKTTSSDIATVGDSYWERLAFDSQITIYGHTLAEEEGIKDLSILYDVIRKPATKPKYKQRIVKRKAETQEEFEQRKAEALETLDEYEARLIQEIKADPDKYLVRREVHRTREQNEAILAELRETIAEMDIYLEYGAGLFPRNDKACSAFGGCPFRGVCAGFESLDDPKFERVDEEHQELPELAAFTNKEDAQDEYSDCPI